MQGSVAREVPESPRQAKAKAKDNKKGRDGGMPAAAIRPQHTSEYAEQLKKVICLPTFRSSHLWQACLAGTCMSKPAKMYQESMDWADRNTMKIHFSSVDCLSTLLGYS